MKDKKYEGYMDNKLRGTNICLEKKKWPVKTIWRDYAWEFSELKK